MRILPTGLLIAALAALAACANNPNRPNDVGNMALPTVGVPGAVSTPPAGRDVGSMTAPSGTGGEVSRVTPAPRTPTDTGNMALPAAAQGNSTPHSF